MNNEEEDANDVSAAAAAADYLNDEDQEDSEDDAAGNDEDDNFDGHDAAVAVMMLMMGRRMKVRILTVTMIAVAAAFRVCFQRFEKRAFNFDNFPLLSFRSPPRTQVYIMQWYAMSMYLSRILYDRISSVITIF